MDEDKFNFLREWVKQSIDRKAFHIRKPASEKTVITCLAALCEEYERRLSDRAHKGGEG